MATEPVYVIIRKILQQDINMLADKVMARAVAQGVKSSPAALRQTVYNVKSELKKEMKKPTAASAARQTTKPAAEPVAVATPAVEAPAAAPVAVAAPVAEAASAPTPLSAVLANIALVNRVVAQAGGSEVVRQTIEAVKSCGGTDAFLQHLDLVVGIRSGDATA